MKILIRDFRATDKKAIQLSYQEAFSKPPLEERIDYKEIERRFATDSLKKGFGCLVARVNNDFAGAVWWEEVDVKELEEKRGGRIANFCREKTSRKIAFSHVMVVKPDFQRLGIGSILKIMQLKGLRQLDYRLVISRFLDKNKPIINLNKKFGFRPTGIKYVSKCVNGNFSGEWYYTVL